MAARKAIDAAILAKTEVTYATDPVPTGAANALRVYGQTVEPFNAKMIPEEYLRGYAGGFSELIGAINKKVSFSVSLAGAGAAGTAPAYSALLRAAVWGETISAGARVEYLQISSAEESVTIYYYDAGVFHKLLGARGDWEIVMGSGGKPELKFTFLGIDGGVATAVATPATTLTAWKDPLVVTNPNTGDLLIGCTYATGALSGGVAYPSKGLSFKGSNNLFHDEMLGGEAIQVERKGITGTVEMDLTAAQEVAMEAIVRAGTLQSFGLAHGTTAGYKIVLYAPAVQMKNPKPVISNGLRRMSYDLSVLPLTGNDDLRLVVL